MKYTATFQFVADIKTTLVFNGDATSVRAIQGMLMHADALAHRGNCIVIKHPVTGLECALSPGDTVTWDSETFRFVVVQNDDKALQWCRIEFDVLKAQSGAIAAEVHFPLTNKMRSAQVINMAAGQPATVTLRVVDKYNPGGEVVYKGDLPFPKTAVERQELPIMFTYRGHTFQAWSEGVQFVISHGGSEAEPIEKTVVCQIIII